MAYTKLQLEALKNTLLASGQPIVASQHRNMEQAIIDEMFDAQTRGNLLKDVQDTVSLNDDDMVLIIRSNGQAYLADKDLFSGVGAVDSVNGQTGVVVLDAGDVGADAAGSASTVATNLSNHISDSGDAHAASAITNTPAGGISATTVQEAINELDTEKQASITFGTGVQTALGVNVGSAGAPVLFNGAGGTPSSMTGTNITGIPQSGVTNLTTDLAAKAATATHTNGLEPANTTGTAISFAVPQIYGSDGSPETGNITVVTTGLIRGTTQLLIHNNGSTPTFGSPIKIISGAYVTGQLNYIMLLAVSTTSVLVTISQEV